MVLFRQLFDQVSNTFTYLLADEQTREALLIDCVFEQHARDRALIRELDLTLRCALDTHCHADHVTGAWLMKQALGCRIGLSSAYGAANIDLPLAHGDTIRFGALSEPVTGTFRKSSVSCPCTIDIIGSASVAPVFTADPAVEFAATVASVPAGPLMATCFGEGAGEVACVTASIVASATATPADIASAGLGKGFLRTIIAAAMIPATCAARQNLQNARIANACTYLGLRTTTGAIMEFSRDGDIQRLEGAEYYIVAWQGELALQAEPIWRRPNAAIFQAGSRELLNYVAEFSWMPYRRPPPRPW